MSLTLSRSIFALLALVVMITFQVSQSSSPSIIDVMLGAVMGMVVAGGLYGIEMGLRRFHLRSFNVVVLGVFLGYLLAESFLLIADAAVGMMSMEMGQGAMQLIRSVTVLACTYAGVVMTARTSEDIHLTIPFLNLRPVKNDKRDILLDESILNDPRILDLASSGILDDSLVLPGFLVQEFNTDILSADETTKNRARRSLDVIKKLEGLPTLALRIDETDFPELKDPLVKLLRLAKHLSGAILTADSNKLRIHASEEVMLINIHHLSKALKPIMQAGETITIKIQRYGKEPRQGVGYLDDGTMVVVNGGGEFLGDTIKVQVLSVKHTSSGRMIFCNTIEQAAAQRAGRPSAEHAELTS